MGYPNLGPFWMLSPIGLHAHALVCHKLAKESHAAEMALYWEVEYREVCKEQRRRADPIIVKHIGRSTWQGTQSEWEKRV